MIRNNPAHDTTNPAGSVRGSYKAPEEVQATLPSVDWESRYNGLVGALMGLCEWAESYAKDKDMHNVVWSHDVRKIISENA